MCLHCTGCGKCADEASAAHHAEAGWDADTLADAASAIGPNTMAVVLSIVRGTHLQDQAIRESLSILSLADRFSEEAVERACAFALKQVPSPRRKFIQAVLESGAAS